MEQNGPDLEAQVWQRVFSRQEEARESRLQNLQSAAQLASDYRWLTQTLTGKPKEQARVLYEAQLGILGCLKGIGILSGRGEEVLKLWNPAKEPPRRLLEKCYHRTRQCMVDYAARSAQTEFGCLYRDLARRAEEQCVRIAQLLGGLK